MSTRSARLLALSVVVGIAGSAVALAGPGRSIESKGFTLVAGEKSGTAAHCPRGLKATGGGFSAPFGEFPGVTEHVTSAPDGRRWRAAVRSFDADRKGTAWAICSKAPDTKIVRETGHFSTGQYAVASATCPRRFRMIGGGAEATGPRRTEIIASAPADAQPGKAQRTWGTFAFSSAPGPDLAVTAYAICERHGGKVKIRSQTKEAGSGRTASAGPADAARQRGTAVDDKFKVDCPSGFQLTSGGFASADLNVRYESARPKGNTWSVDLRHYTHTDPVTAYAVCRKH